jgi:probable RNA-binding protein EIF1AD
MPTKFRKNVYIKRGDFLIVEPIEEGDKVQATIVHILAVPQVKWLKRQGKWPTAFADGSGASGDGEREETEFEEAAATGEQDPHRSVAALSFCTFFCFPGLFAAAERM